MTAADDFDEVEVIRLLDGDTTIPLYRGVRLTAEVVEAVRRLCALGLNDRQVSDRLRERLSNQAVLKVRVRYGIPAAQPRHSVSMGSGA